MKKGLFLSALVMAGLLLACAPTTSALSCTQYVDVDHEENVAPSDVHASVDVSANPAGLVECLRTISIIRP